VGSEAAGFEQAPGDRSFVPSAEPLLLSQQPIGYRDGQLQHWRESVTKGNI